MSFDAERHLCAAWRTAAPTVGHQVNNCGCWTCQMTRGLEALIVEVDRLTGPVDDVGTGGVPGGA